MWVELHWSSVHYIIFKNSNRLCSTDFENRSFWKSMSGLGKYNILELINPDIHLIKSH
jgi:hypothetical protein